MEEIVNHHQPHLRLLFIQRRWCFVYGGFGRKFPIMSSFWKTKWWISISTSPIRSTDGSTQQKAFRINQQNHIIFHQDNARPHVSLMTRKKTVMAWLRSSGSSSVVTKHRTFECPFISVYKILLMEKISIP